MPASDIIEKIFWPLVTALSMITLYFVIMTISRIRKRRKELQPPLPPKEIKKEVKKIIKKEAKKEVIEEDHPPVSFANSFWARLKKKFYPDRLLLINMELLNGFHTSFLVKDKGEGFKYKKKFYKFDNEQKYYHVSAKFYAYDYHEEIALPIRRRVPVSDIKKTLETIDQSQVEYAINPATLERFIISKIAEGIMKGQEIDSTLRFLKLMSIGISVIVLIHLLLFMQKTGMLAAISSSLPF